MRLTLCFAAAAASLAVAAQTASAATVSVAGNTLRVTAASGEQNALEIAKTAPLGTPVITVRDTGTDPTVAATGPRCRCSRRCGQWSAPCGAGPSGADG